MMDEGPKWWIGNSDVDPLLLCAYEDRWTDEVGMVPVCVVHGNNSRHEDSADPHRPCLTVDPYP